MATAISGPFAYVWCEPIEREDYRVSPGDIQEALAWFREKFGHDATAIQLSPKNYEKFKSEAPDDIQVLRCPGVAGWEIRLLTDNKNETAAYQQPEQKIGVEETPPEPPQPSLAPKISDPKLKHGVMDTPKKDKVVLGHPGGRPPKPLPMRKIRKLASDGVSSRNISKILSIPRSTTQRAINSLQGELL